MTMWQGNSLKHQFDQIMLKFSKGGSMGHGTQNNPWMKLMGIVSHKDRRHDAQPSGQGGSNEKNLNQ